MRVMSIWYPVIDGKAVWRLHSRVTAYGRQESDHATMGKRVISGLAGAGVPS